MLPDGGIYLNQLHPFGSIFSLLLYTRNKLVYTGLRMRKDKYAECAELVTVFVNSLHRKFQSVWATLSCRLENIVPPPKYSCRLSLQANDVIVEHSNLDRFVTSP